MERGDSGETKPEDTANPPPPVNPPPPPPAETDSDSDDEDSIMSSTTEIDYLKYLASEYKTFKDNPNLSDVINLERELGTALWNIPNKYKVGGWSHVADTNETHQVRLGITENYTPVVAPTMPDPGDNTLSRRQLKNKEDEYHDYCVCTTQCLKLLETVFIILKRNHTEFGNYKPTFTVKKAFKYLKDRYVDEKDKRKAAWALDREIKDMTYTHSLQGPLKYFEDLNDKFLRLDHLKFLKISDDDDKKTIAEHAFEQTVPPIAMNEINAKWKQKSEDEQTWTHYQQFWTDNLPTAFRDHGVKEQQLATRMRAMEANMEGIRSEQQTIQNDFYNFGRKVINGFLVDTGSIAGASQGDALIAQLKAEMAKQQADVASKLNTIMAALGN